MNEKLRITLIIILILAAIYCGYKLVNHYIIEPAKINATVEDFKASAKTDDTQCDIPKVDDINFKELRKKNKDIKAWLTVPSIGVDHPIVQGKNNEYYLHKDLYRNFSQSGTLFLSVTSSPSSDTNIIYGHNMRNGTMFGKLDYFKDIEFLRKNPDFVYYTSTKACKYRIIAVCNVSVNYTLNKFNYTITDFMSENGYDNFVNDIKKRSLFKSNLTPKYGEQLLILSTCDYDFKDERVIVVAKPINKNDKKPIYSKNKNVKMPKEYYY